MKELHIVQEFAAPLEMLLKAREERYRHLDKFPELKNVRLVEEKKEDRKLYQIRHISIGASLPAILTQVLPKGADTLIEESEFFLDTHIHKFRVTPAGNQDIIFVIEGESIYERKEESRSQRKYNIRITSKVPFLGFAIENAIAEIYTHSLKKDQDSINQFLALLENGKL